MTALRDRAEAGTSHLTPSWRARLACPRCHRRLAETDERAVLRCTACGARYRGEGRILSFALRDHFYDEHGFTTAGRDFTAPLLGGLGLYYARHHYLWDIARAVDPGAAIVEIGCGGGSRFLAARFDMLGIDLSATSAREASRTYASVVRASALAIPLADESVDAVVSSFLLEHLGDGAAEAALREMHRVLRPGGRMVHYFDLETAGPFFGWAKRQPWYDEIFVRAKGHLGYRTLAQWQRLFTSLGFRVVGTRLSCKTWIQDLSIWAALDHPLVEGLPRALARVASSVRGLGWAADVALMILDDTVFAPLPDRWASKAILRLEKPA